LTSVFYLEENKKKKVIQKGKEGIDKGCRDGGSYGGLEKWWP